MAQLIKLQDYVSRYEWNAFRYPSQYIRLKQENWKKLNYLWNNPEENVEDESNAAETATKLSWWKSLIRKENEQEEVHQQQKEQLPDTESELKQYFLDKLLLIQLKWATSTVTDLSFIDKTYYNNSTLKYFLQRFPDTYLVMYYPIFNIKNAPIDGEIIVISPIGIEIIILVEENEKATIMAGEERTWTVETGQEQKRILSPLIALKRTEQIVKSILSKIDLDFPVEKTVLSRKNHIVFSNAPYNTKVVDRIGYEQWFKQKRLLVSPLKNRQLKAAEALLNHCQTTSVKRPEWEEDSNTFHFMDEE
ncbi:NERD domain-containing protein [Virgibacillus sp. C22-A2]|uniref:NERD domain-containing protein n=1 Tax=Virgibacillus tibetensis TaxID=3042313 RepID=A0ABU6K9L0_9BACI|nr:NERD domain-containing protein [Virgibacillus sp. C22-A2]